MKITKTRLRQLIKEELSRLNENEPPRPGEQGSADARVDSMSWESLWEHPQYDEGISDVKAAARNAGIRVSSFMDEYVGERDDIAYLESAFQETSRVNHETSMDSGTIIIGTVDGVDVAIWDVMGYRTWMY